MIATLGVLILFAALDNNVEWSGISHIDWLDRAPRCPVNGEAFSVEFQTWRLDIDSARVFVDDGVTQQWVNANWSHDRGPYAIWEATVPATAEASLSYYIELTDGTDVDFLSISGMSETTPTDGGWLIDYTTLSHAPIGATPATGGGVFKVWATVPDRAIVSGSFNNWATRVQTGGTRIDYVGDYLTGFVPNAFAGEQYKYAFRGNVPDVVIKSDPRAAAFDPTSGGGNEGYRAMIVDHDAYPWTNDSFSPPQFEDMILYQIHVGTFSGFNDPVASGAWPGTYRDVAAHVDHLVDLGVNVAYIMPPTEFPFDFSAGYNPISQYAPEWAYGDPNDFKYMVDTLNANGIAVIIDIVWNHFDGSDNYLWNFDSSQIYFDDPSEQTPWGSQADFNNEKVRSYFLDSALSWIHNYRINGFRMDATSYMDTQGGAGWSLMQAFNDLIDSRAVDAFCTAEELPDNGFVTKPTSAGGAGFDSQWYDLFTDNLRAQIINAGFGQGSVNVGAVADAIDGSGPDLSYTKVTNYVEAHDEIWPDTGGARLVNIIDPSGGDDVYARSRTKLAYGILFTAPGVPMFHQGAEWLENIDFQPGFDSGRIDWSKKVTNSDIYQFFRDIIEIRKTNGALRSNAGVQVYKVDEVNNIIAWQRYDLSGNVIVVVANFNDVDFGGYTLGLPAFGDWFELINSDSTIYGGDNFGNGGSFNAGGGPADGMITSAAINIPKRGVLVLRAADPPDPGEQWLMDGSLDPNTVELANNNGVFLRAGLKGNDLYLATVDAGEGNDHFIYIARQPGALQAANWAKAGQVAAWDAYLADENDNSFSGWFDNNSFALAQTGPNGGVLEGTINLASEYGSVPSEIWLAVGIFGNQDGEPLLSDFQVGPTQDDDGNLDGAEWIRVSLPDLSVIPACPEDLNLDGSINSTDLSTLLSNFGITSGATRAQGDINGDGAVDSTDLAMLLAVFGASC